MFTLYLQQYLETEGFQFFQVSQLPKDVLQKIWNLSDRDHDKQLNQQEFRLAMHLIYCKLKGYPLPDILSKELLWSAGILVDSRPLPSLPPKTNVTPRGPLPKPPLPNLKSENGNLNQTH